MNKIKLNRARRLSTTARCPETYRVRLASIPQMLIDALTAAQIAALIDGPIHSGYLAGWGRGYDDAR